jgi:SAM-dependent methyltransferase
MATLVHKLLRLGTGMRKVEFILPYVQNKDVLDIGVVQHKVENYKKPNWLHKHIAKASKRCIGIDYLKEGVDYLNSIGFDVRLADAQNFSLEDRFDVVVAGDILEHLHDLKGFFTSVSSCLKPTGKLIITTPNPWFFIRIIKVFLTGKEHASPEHVTWYSYDVLSELLRRYGFKIEAARFGSSEHFLDRLFFLPKSIRHTSVWVVASRSI